MKIFHHNDLDGKCAAAIVLKKYPDCKTRSIDYKDNPDFIDEVKPGEKVFIVDFSFKPHKMKELFGVTEPRNIIWIDHHKTAKDYTYFYDNFPVSLNGLIDFSEPGLSGCELTWKFLYPSVALPSAVRLLGDYDTWRFDQGLRTKQFQEGMKLTGNSPNHPVWRSLLNNLDPGEPNIPTVDEVVSQGYTAIIYRDFFCKNYRNSFGHEVEFENYTCYAMNLHMVGSLGFGPYIDSHKIVISYAHAEGKFTVSMYTKREDVDVSIIAKKYGGGGHSKAAGFICSKLPWERN